MSGRRRRRVWGKVFLNEIPCNKTWSAWVFCPNPDYELYNRYDVVFLASLGNQTAQEAIDRVGKLLERDRQKIEELRERRRVR